MRAESGRSIGGAILGWWQARIGDREAAEARALSARLRRAAGPVEVLCERGVHDLVAAIPARVEDERDRSHAAQAARHPEAVVRIAQVLAEVRTHEARSLARRLGDGDPPRMSDLRFRRLLRAEGDEFVASLRRAVVMADRACDVAALGRDLLLWDEPCSGEAARVRWTFHYHGAEPPKAVAAGPDEETTR